MALTGNVKWFNPDKGFGFVTRDDGEADVFLHVKAVRASQVKTDDIQKGVRVSFEVEDGRSSLAVARLSLI